MGFNLKSFLMFEKILFTVSYLFSVSKVMILQIAVYLFVELNFGGQIFVTGEKFLYLGTLPGPIK